MSELFFEEYSSNEIEKTLRDLSISENLDLKKLFEEYQNTIKINNKSKKIKKIIADNKKKLYESKISLDEERLEYFKNLKEIDYNLFNEIKFFDTEYGKIKMKLKLLKIAFKLQKQKYIIDLYLQILSSNDKIKYSRKEKKLMEKVTRYMENLDYKKMQFQELSNQLKPLDFYNTYKKTLDDWQIDVIKNLNKGNSVLVSAPTSCGKTWLSLYPGIQNKKILFIVPTEALVFQVGALFSKFINQPTLISENIFYSTDNNIIIGTPKSIEDNLPIIKTKFDIIIVDEIHNLNNLKIHHFYERILKIFSNTQLLALSATIGEPKTLIKWLRKIGYNNIKLITYNTRFLNLQRQLFINNKLIKLHPISCLSIEDIKLEFLSNNLSMTPYDTIVLYESLKKIFPREMIELDINNIFPENDKRLSLMDSKYYEDLLKKKLVYLKENFPNKIKNLLNSYTIEEKTTEENINLYTLFREIKDKNLTPCIVFQENPFNCKEIFTKLVGYLEKLETLNHPFYYENLEYRQKKYEDSIKELEKFKATIKISSKDKNAKIIIDDRIDGQKALLRKKFISEFKVRLKKQIDKINKSSETKGKIKTVQVNHLQNEIIQCEKYKLRYVDIFKKHEDFSLSTYNPMSAEKIREIKKMISKKLGFDVSYTNVFMQGLKRGLGIYTKQMPSIYNLVVQNLSQNGELGFVVADEQLALGINMPFRSTCILGYNNQNDFKTHNYLQMIGRSGRRGKDREGHIVYANVNWKKLMKSSLEKISSPFIHIPVYKSLSLFSNIYDDNIDKIFSLPLDNKNYSDLNKIDKFTDNRIFNEIIWKLRLYDINAINFCNNITNINDKLNINLDINSIYTLIELIGIYFFEDDVKNKLINSIKNHEIEPNHNLLNEYLLIVKNIYSSLSKEKENKNLQKHLRYSFIKIKEILNSTNNLN